MFLDQVKQLTDDQLLDGLITCHPDVLIFLQLEWNQRHPENPIPIDKSIETKKK